MRVLCYLKLSARDSKAMAFRYSLLSKAIGTWER